MEPRRSSVASAILRGGGAPGSGPEWLGDAIDAALVALVLLALALVAL